MRQPTCVLLDLDGTLIDSKPGIVASFNAALQALGHRPDPSFDLTFVIGPVLTDVMGEVLAHYGDARVDEAVAAYRRHYGEVGLFDVAPYDGIAALLASLKAAGLRLFLATSKRTAFAVRILDHLGMSDRFDGIYGSEPDGSRDGKPELIAAILRRETIRADEAIMVGDAATISRALTPTTCAPSGCSGATAPGRSSKRRVPTSWSRRPRTSKRPCSPERFAPR